MDERSCQFLDHDGVFGFSPHFDELLLGRKFQAAVFFSVKDILIGVGSAVVLYGIFYIGDILSKLMFDFAAGQVANIYQMKEGENELYLGLLLILLVHNKNLL